MKMVKKTLEILLKIIGVFFILVSIYLLMAWLLPFIKVNKDFVEDKNGIELFIKSNGVHTDLVMPVKSAEINWFDFLPASDFESVDERFAYIAIGWGDKAFYLNTPEWKDLTAKTACNAAFGLGQTAMHITYIYSVPIKSDKCKSVFISKEQYQLLITFIKSSFEMKDNKPIVIIHPGYSNYDCFYEAYGSYNMLNTCNVWTGKALKAIGVKIGAWTPFQGGIIDNFK